MASAKPPRKGKKTLGKLVNDSSRLVEKYVIKPVKGRPLRTDLDNIGEVIAEVEGDDYR
jgi:hypothetical protein